MHTATLEELDAATEKHNIFIDLAEFVKSCFSLCSVGNDGEAQPSAGCEEQIAEQDIELDFEVELHVSSETLSQPPTAEATVTNDDPRARARARAADDPKSSNCLDIWTDEPAERTENEEVVGHVLSLARAVELLSLQMHTMQTQMSELDEKLDRSLKTKEA